MAKNKKIKNNQGECGRPRANPPGPGAGPGAPGIPDGEAGPRGSVWDRPCPTSQKHGEQPAGPLRWGREVSACFGARSIAIPRPPSMDVTAAPPSRACCSARTVPSVSPSRAPGGCSGTRPQPSAGRSRSHGAVAPATTAELLTALGEAQSGSRRGKAERRRLPARGRSDAAAAEGVPWPGGSPEVRSGLMSSKASGRSPASQLVRRCRPVPGSRHPPRPGAEVPRGQSLIYRLLPRDTPSIHPGAALMAPSLLSEFSGTVGSAWGRASITSRPPQLHTGQRGEPSGPPSPPARPVLGGRVSLYGPGGLGVEVWSLRQHLGRLVLAQPQVLGRELGQGVEALHGLGVAEEV